MEEKKRILIAEDEAPMREALAHKLRNRGFVVLEADNGKTCLDMALSEHPDLVLMDVGLPVMNGLEMLEELRKDSWGSQVPVIVLTAYTDMDKVADAIERHTINYFVKSQISLEAIIDAISDTLNT